LRIPHGLDSRLTDRVVSLTRRPHRTPRERFLLLLFPIFMLEAANKNIYSWMISTRLKCFRV
jgi:hypothetical protein